MAGQGVLRTRARRSVCRHRLGCICADIGAALLLRHPHADGDARLVGSGRTLGRSCETESSAAIRPTDLGSSRIVATAAFVMVIGQQCPASIWVAM